MWYNFIKNSDTLKAIYGDKFPNLENVVIHEIGVNTQNGFHATLNCTIDEMPMHLPMEWGDNNFDRVILVFKFSCLEINSLDLNGGNYSNVAISLKEKSNSIISVIGKDITGRCVFDFDSLEVYLDEIYGYNFRSAYEYD